MEDKVVFPGTYSGEQTWDTKTPQHGHASVELAKFTNDDSSDNDDDNKFVVWVNTWNHLMGDVNNNSTMPIDYCKAKP